LIDFLTTARKRLLSGRLLVGRAFALSVGRGVASLLSAVWVILIARQLPLNQFGEVSVALALIIILTSFSDFGLQFILARDVVETGRIRRAVLDGVVMRRLILAAAFAVLMVVLYVVATHDRNLAVPLVFSLSIVGAALYNPTITGYRATGNIRLEVISEIGSRALVLSAGGLWVLAGGGIIAVAVLGFTVSYSAPPRERDRDYELVRLMVDVLNEVDHKYVNDLDPDRKRKLVEVEDFAFRRRRKGGNLDVVGIRRVGMVHDADVAGQVVVEPIAVGIEHRSGRDDPAREREDVGFALRGVDDLEPDSAQAFGVSTLHRDDDLGLVAVAATVFAHRGSRADEGLVELDRDAGTAE